MRKIEVCKGTDSWSDREVEIRVKHNTHQSTILDLTREEAEELERLLGEYLALRLLAEPLEFGARVTDAGGKRWLHTGVDRTGGWCCEGMMALGKWSDIRQPATLGWTCFACSYPAVKNLRDTDGVVKLVCDTHAQMLEAGK